MPENSQESGELDNGPKDTASTTTIAEPSKSWIKDVSSAVGVIAAAVGIVISLLSLKQKADTENKTAEINERTLIQKARADDASAAVNLTAERIKLTIAESEMREKRDEARDASVRQEITMREERRSKEEAEAREDEQKLSGVIDHLFTSATTSEGDLAVLYHYADRSGSLRGIIVNAVIVRLTNPRSPDEISLGLRLLNHIGPSTLDALIEINREARSNHDDLLLSRFRRDVYSQLATLQKNETRLAGKDATEKLRDITWKASTDAADGSILPARYVRATISRDGDPVIEKCLYLIETEHQSLVSTELTERISPVALGGDRKNDIAREKLLAQLLLATRSPIIRAVSALPQGSQPVDLHATYLGDSAWPAGNYPDLLLEHSYLSGSTLAGANLTVQTKRNLSLADKINLADNRVLGSRMRQVPQFAKDAKLDWQEADAVMSHP